MEDGRLAPRFRNVGVCLLPAAAQAFLLAYREALSRRVRRELCKTMLALFSEGEASDTQGLFIQPFSSLVTWAHVISLMSFSLRLLDLSNLAALIPILV